MVKLNSNIYHIDSHSLSGGASITCGVDVEFPRYGIHEVKEDRTVRKGWPAYH